MCKSEGLENLREHVHFSGSASSLYLSNSGRLSGKVLLLR